jgi:hypothetical protein
VLAEAGLEILPSRLIKIIIRETPTRQALIRYKALIVSFYNDQALSAKKFIFLFLVKRRPASYYD